MSGLEESLVRLAEHYRRFAADEAQGVSPHYERLTQDIAASADILRFLIDLPPPRRQPNLLLAAATLIGGRPPDIASLTAMVARRADELRDTMLARTTQTNEPARCAVLLSLLAALPQPLALIEVGASAGLCLLPDRYGYDWGHARLALPSPDAPVFGCAPEARQRFVDTVRGSRAAWISNETPRVFPDIAARASRPAPRWRFLLAVDGEPKAWTGPHGQSLEWLPGR